MMTRRKILSDHGIANLKPKEAARYMAPDPEYRGLYIRVIIGAPDFGWTKEI